MKYKIIKDKGYGLEHQRLMFMNKNKLIWFPSKELLIINLVQMERCHFIKINKNWNFVQDSETILEFDSLNELKSEFPEYFV